MPSLRQQNPRLYDRVYDALRRGASGAEVSRRYRRQFNVSDYKIQQIRRSLLQTSERVGQSPAGDYSRRSERSYQTYRNRREGLIGRQRRYPILQSQRDQSAPYNIVAIADIYCDNELINRIPVGYGAIFLPNESSIMERLDEIIQEGILTATVNQDTGYILFGCDGELTWEFRDVRIYAKSTQAA